MKKLISILSVITMLFVMTFALTGCENNQAPTTTKVTAKPTYTVKAFKVEATVPTVEGQKEPTPTYKISNTGLKFSNADVGLIGEKVEFDFDYTSYTYNSYAEYKAKYGTKETSYDNYIEFLEDATFDSVKADQKNFEKTKVAGYDAVKYKFSGSMIYVIKCDKLDTKRRFECRVYPVNSQDKIEDLLADEAIKSVMESFVIDAYNE